MIGNKIEGTPPPVENGSDQVITDFFGIVHFPLFFIEGVFDTQFCERVVSEIKAGEFQSNRATVIGRSRKVSGSRTNTTASVPIDHPLTEYVKSTLNDVLGNIGATWGGWNTYGHEHNWSEFEPLQIQIYGEGEKYNAHFDTFDLDAVTTGAVAAQRTWTAVIYLNDPIENGGSGGFTTFTEPELSVAPKTGSVLIWNNLTREGARNKLTKHSGEPVKGGKKYIITVWWNDKSYADRVRRGEIPLSDSDKRKLEAVAAQEKKQKAVPGIVGGILACGAFLTAVAVAVAEEIDVKLFLAPWKEGRK